MAYLPKIVTHPSANRAQHRVTSLICPKAPLRCAVSVSVQVFFCQFPSRLLCGEVREVVVELVNTGATPLHNVTVALTHPDFITFGSSPAAATSPPAETPAGWPSSIYPILSSGPSVTSNGHQR